MKYVYPALFHLEDDGIFFISFPDLDGCFTQGTSIAEGMAMAADALNLMLWHMEEEHLTIPEPSSLQDLKTENDDFATLICADTLTYRKQHDTKAVRKNLSIPRWLDTLASERNVNFSNILQNALMHELGLDKT
ncbi:type II toxin-antitoxin system HicB family antitoxin [Selenomonas sputigena]|uniref:Type II toxin-antitoxin system HicB family antitoxin n=1 Tax=Selenomonas sputigena TaxID=69823 RepID=A0ABV3X8B3_9FIRM